MRCGWPGLGSGVTYRREGRRGMKMADGPAIAEGRRPKNVQHEWTLQRAVAAFLSKALPHDAYWTSLDMGRSRSAAEGQLRKMRGVKAGVPDIFILYRGIGLWCELKAGASLSDPQKLTRDALRDNGHLWELCRSVEAVEAACLYANIPLRATLGAIRARIEEQNARLPAKRKKAPRRPQTGDRITVAQAHKMGMWRG